VLKTFATETSVGPVRAGNDGLLPRGRKAAFQPWAGLKLGPKELAGQRRVAPVAALVGVLATDRAFLAHAKALRAEAGPLAEYQLTLVKSGHQPKRLYEVAADYMRRRGYSQRVFARLLAEAVALEDPRLILPRLTCTTVFVDDQLTDEDPRHWPHAKRWHEAALILAAVGAGRCPHLVERHGQLECCGTVPSRVERDGRQRRYCTRHQPNTKFEKSADRSDREAITNLLRAAGKALGVPLAGSTAAA
jgi:hypothetical protein